MYRINRRKSKFMINVSPLKTKKDRIYIDVYLTTNCQSFKGTITQITYFDSDNRVITNIIQSPVALYYFHLNSEKPTKTISIYNPEGMKYIKFRITNQDDNQKYDYYIDETKSTQIK